MCHERENVKNCRPNLSICFTLLRAHVTLDLVLCEHLQKLPSLRGSAPCRPYTPDQENPMEGKQHPPDNNFKNNLFFTPLPFYRACGFSHLFGRCPRWPFTSFGQWFVLNPQLLQSAGNLLRPSHLQCKVMGKGHILWENVRADGTRNWKKCNAGNSLDLWPRRTDWLD